MKSFVSKNPLWLAVGLAGLASLNTLADSAPCGQIDLAAAGGDRGGNAGRGGEAVFQSMAGEIQDWVKRTRLEDIDVGTRDRQLISEKIANLKFRVCFVDHEIIVGSRPRTCRNSFDPLRPDLIECSSEAFAKEGAQTAADGTRKEGAVANYITVFHELLGVAGIEKNVGDESDYFISQQIRKFVSSKTSYELADHMIVASAVAPACSFVYVVEDRRLDREIRDRLFENLLLKKGYKLAYNKKDFRYKFNLTLWFGGMQESFGNVRSVQVTQFDGPTEKKIGETSSYSERFAGIGIYTSWKRLIHRAVDRIPDCSQVQ